MRLRSRSRRDRKLRWSLRRRRRSRQGRFKSSSTHQGTLNGIGALAQLVERLLCKQDVIGSNPLGSTINQQDQKAPFWFFLVLLGRIARSVAQFTSFREIIGVIGRTRVGVRCQYDPSGSESNSDVVQVKYTNQMRDCCMAIAQKVLSAWKGRETYMLLTGSEPCATQKDARRDRPSGLSSSGSNQAR